MKLSFFRIFAVVVAFMFLFAGCAKDDPGISEQTSVQSAQHSLQKTATDVTSQITGVTGSDMLTAVNVQLEKQGKPCRVLMMEYITAPTSAQPGATIFAKNVGNKKLSAHWVPFDPNRRENGIGDRNITYAVDQVEGAATGGLSGLQTAEAIDNAMETWDNQSCATIPITKVDLGIMDLGYVQWLLGFGGVPGWGADITHAGWLPATFFDAVAPGGGEEILGVTFTFIWIDDVTGDPTDMDKNGRDDVAFREIYYNNGFLWSISAPTYSDPEYDVESIVLHEVGHGLSQGHFGKIFFDGKGTSSPSLQHLHFAPRAVMNAMAWDTQRELLGSDIAGHCAIWGSWPNN